MHVASHFEKSAIWTEFGAVAKALEDAIRNNALDEIKRLIRINHCLLDTLGVVPQKVRQFISCLEREGASCKICGAGASAGDKSGIVMVLADTPPQAICDQFGYNLLKVEGEPRGVRIVH